MTGDLCPSARIMLAFLVDRGLTMRISTSISLALALLPFLAVEAGAADCGSLQLVNTVQMARTTDGVDLVPLKINGADQKFIFDTGGATTMITREAAEKLQLRIQPTHLQMTNVAGGTVSDQAFIDDFEVGRLHGKKMIFPVAPFKNMDGILSLNFLLPYDIDVDFGTDKLNFFSQDHCPGGVQYWKADAVAVVPFTVDDAHIYVSVTVDGQIVSAILDTGASDTIMRMDIARQRYELNLGDEASPERKRPADADFNTPKFYTHTFKSLAFGAIQVNNPHMGILEDVWKRDESSPQISNRARSSKDRVNLLPELTIGMNVMRKLHIYFAFAERKLYVSPASSETARP